MPIPVVYIITAIIGISIILLVFRLFRQQKHNVFKPPFLVDERRPRQPLEIDQKKRALRLKQRFSEKELPSQIDAIVIGSGISGLATAAILAKTGRKVVVLEQHDQAGGCCHTFIENGYEWDVGIHYVGEMGPQHFQRFMVDQLTEGQLDWKAMDSDSDNVILANSQTKLPIWGDRKRFLEDLIKRYPEHEKGLREFFCLLHCAFVSLDAYPIFKILPLWLVKLVIKSGIYKLFTKMFTYFHEETVSQVMERLFGDDEEVKLVLGYIFGDIGVEPSRCGFGMLSILYEHYTGCAYYPIGGSSEIAYSIIPIIEKAGGRVFVNANVAEILVTTANKEAIGVRVGSVDIKAPLVISSAGVSNTFRHLLPKQVAMTTKIGQLLDVGRIYPGYSFFQVFIGLNGSQEELKLPNKNFWVYNELNIDKAVEELHKIDLDTMVDSGTVPFSFVAFPSAKDPSYNQRFAGRSVCTIVTVTPIEWFRKWEDEPVKKMSKDYQALKMRLARKCWDQVVQLFPNLEDRLDHIDAGSPLTAAYYLNANAGEAYGLDEGKDRFSPEVVINLRPKVPEIGNLYLTGQDVMLAGFGGAFNSAIVTCQTILFQLGECYNLYGTAQKLFRKHVQEKPTKN